MAVISSDEAADEERWIRYGSAPLIATLLLPIIIGAILLLKCVFTHCCVRKTTTKDEMYGLEGRMTMLTTADSNFAPLPNSSTATPASSSAGNSISLRAKSPPIGISKRNSSDGETEVKVGHHNPPGTCSSVVEKAAANTGGNNNDSIIEGSPNSSVYNDESRLAMEYRRSSGASRLTSSQDSSDLAGSLKRASAQHRQLPDLPQTPAGGATSHPARRSSSVLSHDGTSELYATVGETPLPEGSSSKRSSHYAQIRENPLASSSGKISLSTSGSLPVVNGVPPGSSSGASAVLRTKGIEATPSSDSETYASTSLHHPYAKLKKNPTVHPYAKVRPAGSNNNEEETDTDNYDLPQFLTRQVVGAGPSASGTSVAGGVSSSQNRPSSSGTIQSSVGVVVGSSADAEGPVPPRRVGRQWRRSSQPQVLNNDNASHFSGDSQDSRGYTSISVREPLSNIRNQVVANTRNYDSHYATVSDDSEEMYAAIDDSNESNYMRIPGDHDNNNPRRPTWLGGGPNVSSPIPERREANSPLPPVPNVPPPDLSPGPPSSTSSIIPPPSSPNAQLPQVPIPSPQASSAHPPVYAQVTKKKKQQQQQQGKVPVTPTASNASTSSSQQIMMREAPLGSETPLPPPPPPVKENSTSHHHSSSSSHYSHQPLHHRSKRAASLMDNSNPMDADTVDSRRWSKADISYSEFEIVRENLFPSPSATNNANITTITDDPPHHHHLLRSPGSGRSDVSPSSSSAIRQQDLVDEDNYNIIPEKTPGGRSSRQSTSTATPITAAPPIAGGAGSGGARLRLDSGNYHEIEPRNLNNTYQEIGGGKEPSDHYQEICDHRRLEDEEDDDDDDGGELYQVIDKKKRNSDEDDDDEDEEEEDQFYERVKKPTTQSKGKKHGYEKIKKKDPSSSSSSKRPGNLSRVKPALGSDEDEDEDDDKPDQLYESVKYPPYERLKVSKDDLLDSEDGKNGSDYYEDIGYSRVKPKTRPKSKTPEQQDALSRHREERDSTRSTSSSSAVVVAGGVVHSPQQDVSQLYAQVDKTKKRTKKSGGNSTMGPTITAAPDNTIQDISGNNNEPLTMPLYSKVNKATKNKSTNKNTATGGGGGGGGGSGDHHDNNHVDQGNRGSATNDNSIEYI